MRVSSAGVLVVNQRGKPVRLIMDGRHAFVAHGDLVGDLDREDGNDRQKDEQDKNSDDKPDSTEGPGNVTVDELQ